MQVLMGGLSDAGIIQDKLKTHSTAVKDLDIDSDGEYLERVWEQDLKIRQLKKEEDDSEVEIEDQADEDFCGNLKSGDHFGELGLLLGKPKSMSVHCTLTFFSLRKKILIGLLRCGTEGSKTNNLIS